MSLIGIRRDRKQQGGGAPSKPPALWKMLATLALVLYLIWYLGQRF